MGADKKRKQLLSRLKKREKKGIAKPIAVKPLTMKTGERNKFTNKNAMVLLAIEKTILAMADDRTGLDDRCVRTALVSSIRGLSSRGTPECKGGAVLEETSSEVVTKAETVKTGLAKQLAENLNNRYESFFPANNSQTTEVWVNGLRAIYTSACSMSDFAPGENSYLQSAKQFLGKVSSETAGES